MTPLEAEIRQAIAIDGPMPVARFMALCLGHPVHGYYVTRDPFGAGGDFITAPETSQMFGEIIGLWAAAVWAAMGTPAVRLIELGPGRGTLMADALRAARVVPGFRAALSIDLVETSPVLRQRQQQALAGLDRPLAWHRDLDEVPPGPAIVIANEFFDALPVHQAVRAADGWHERMVGVDRSGALAFGLAPDPIADFARLAPGLAQAPPGAVFEWRPDHLAVALARRLARDGGAALIIDYGHAVSAAGDTLQAVGAHAAADPLARPGEIDLTAHVDFAALCAAARRGGARWHGLLPQGQFLHRLGIATRADRLKAAASPAQAAAIDAAAQRLTGPAPGMGELFKVAALAHPAIPALPGFEAALAGGEEIR
jgi:NADH dehydrogenase [ubiquinone] 1 alpha subcomplex assembly factor 7